MPTLNSAKLYLGDTLIGSAALNDAKVYLGDTLIIGGEIPTSTNLWSISDKTLILAYDYGSLTDTHSIDFDTYVNGVSANGYWNGRFACEAVVSNEDVTITSVDGAYGILVPMDLEVGASYKISLTMSGASNARVSASYYNESGIYQTFEYLLRDKRDGAFETTFTVKDYAYFCLHLRVDTPGVSVMFSDIQIEKA